MDRGHWSGPEPGRALRRRRAHHGHLLPPVLPRQAPSAPERDLLRRQRNGARGRLPAVRGRGGGRRVPPLPALPPGGSLARSGGGRGGVPAHGRRAGPSGPTSVGGRGGPERVPLPPAVPPRDGPHPSRLVGGAARGAGAGGATRGGQRDERHLCGGLWLQRPFLRGSGRAARHGAEDLGERRRGRAVTLRLRNEQPRARPGRRDDTGRSQHHAGRRGGSAPR